MARVLPFCFLIELMRKIQFHIMKKKKDFNFFRSIFMLFKISGLAPFSVVISKQKQSTPMRFCYSRIGSIYNITLLSTLLLCDCANMNPRESKRIKIWGSVGRGMHIGNIVTASMSLSMTLIMYCMKQNVMVTISNQLTELANRLETHSHYQSLLQRRKYIGVTIISMYILNVLVAVVCWIAISTLDFRIFFHMIGLSMTKFLQGLFMVQYALLLSFLEHEYESLNISLEILVESYKKKFQDIIGPIATASCVEELRDKLFFIKNTRQILCEVSDQISDTYELPALITISYFCVKFIFDTHIIMSSVIFTSSLLAVLEKILSVVLIIKDVIPIIVLTMYGNRIIEQTQRTSAIVHKIMAECPANMSLMKYQLQQFSMGLLHQGEISFTACGFIPISGSLLKSIISTTITYMIILLQYTQTK